MPTSPTTGGPSPNEPNPVRVPDQASDRPCDKGHRAPLYAPRMATPATELEVDGRTVRVTNPDKVFFPARGETKLDLAQYYVAVGEGALRGVRERPTVLKRYPDGATGEPFFQKRAPAQRPDWIETVRVTFPSGRHADELCPLHVA